MRTVRYQAHHHHTTTIHVASSNEYISSWEDVPRNVTPGPSRVWRPSEPSEDQQSVPDRPWLQPARRGPAFPEGESGIPYISEHDQATITAWFEQNLPPLLCEWDQPISAPANDELPSTPGEPNPIPLTGYQWLRNFPGHDQNILNQEKPYPSLSPTNPIASHSPAHSGTLTSGQSKTLTLTTQNLNPLSCPQRV